MDRAELVELLAVKVIQYESDRETIDWPEDKCREILAERSAKHYGDCVKNPITCGVCLAEDAYRFAEVTADAILARSGVMARL